MSRIASKAVCLAVAVAAVCVFSQAAAGERASIVRLMGKAEILKAGEWRPAHAGHEVEQGESVRVVGQGQVTLRAAGGKVHVTGKDNTTIAYDGEVDAKANPWKSARLARAGQLDVAAGAQTQPQFYCPEGEVGVQVTPGQTLSLVTPLITASVRGTSFNMGVSCDSTSRVGVCNGSVVSYSRVGRVQSVCPGQQTATTAKEYNEHLKKLGYCLPEGADWREYDYSVFEELDERVLGKWFPN